MSRPQISLADVIGALQPHLGSLEAKRIRPALIHARLSDRLRDAAIEPPPPATVVRCVSDLDEHGWRRLALLVSALDTEGVHRLLGRLALGRAPAELVSDAFVRTVTDSKLLTLDLLRESPVRLEELARRWLSHLGADIQGESTVESAERLRRIDYALLLEKAEQAKRHAEGRMAALRAAQEKADRMRSPRSKW